MGDYHIAGLTANLVKFLDFVELIDCRKICRLHRQPDKLPLRITNGHPKSFKNPLLFQFGDPIAHRFSTVCSTAEFLSSEVV